MGLAAIGKELSESDVRGLMRLVDKDDSGAIDMAEFVQVRPPLARMTEDDRG